MTGGETRVVDLLEGSTVQAAHAAGDVLLVVRTHDVRAFSLNDGRPLGHAVSAHRWVHGRFFTSGERFFCATWDGSSVRLEPVVLPNVLTGAVVVVFDRVGHEGPWVVLRSGEIMSCATGQRVTLANAVPAGIEHAMVSADGHRLYLSKKGFLNLIHLDTGRNIEVPGGTEATTPQLRSALESAPSLPSWLVYQSVDAVAVQGTQLWFRGRKGRWRVLLLERSGELTIGKVSTQPPPLEEAAVSFSSLPAPLELGCSLRAATWPSGSKIFLDNRGLLHLKSHLPSVPEVSLVLSNGSVAGWTSDGAVCGPDFFLPETDNAQPQVVRRAVLKFLAHL